MPQHVREGVTSEADDRLAESLGWMDRGTEFFLGQLGRLSDEDLGAPSALPGWTRLHVVSHLARNARALLNLVRWATTGIETPMYPSPEDRRDDIETGARQPAASVRADALAEAVRLKEVLLTVPPAAWSAPVRTALGQPAEARLIPWMRVREVWVHGVDLGAGATFSDIDPSVARALLEEAADRLADRTDVPALRLVASDGGDVDIAVGARGGKALSITASTNALAGWLLGRTAGDDLTSSAPLPQPPSWL